MDNQLLDNVDSSVKAEPFKDAGRFNPSQDSRFTGDNSAEYIKSMMWKIEEAISEYVSHVDHKLKECQPALKPLLYPLRNEGFVDEHRKSIFGKPWYDLEKFTIQETETHTPLTYALRAMIRYPENEPLIFSRPYRTCRDLPFGPVLKALIYWFVFDIFQDKFDILELPNLKVIQSVLAAVRNTGNENKLFQAKLKTPSS